ncbi:MAG: cytochrome b/b6 domain-containing protein [Oscillatoriales cyanobacterium]|nr:MAG: cytochrome b/b6 domain-containing protein [Oscillatoriales cyanobacterium]
MSVKPYQPLALRLLHGTVALFGIAAWITGLLVYDSWDGRFGGLKLTLRDRNLIDLHGTFGFFLFYLFILFAIYSLTTGRRKLVQSTTIKQLAQVGKPVWWIGLQRVTNTTMLLAAIAAVGSGKLQDENWLPNGDLNQIAYFAHLISWVLVFLGLAVHVLMSAKVGGAPLLLSMVDRTARSDDWLVQKIQQLFIKK